MERPRGRLLPWVLGLAACALALRLYGLSWGLPEVYEEAAPFGIAWKMWGWGLGQRFDLNPHTFGYPSLAFYLQMAGQGLLFLLYRVFGHAGSALDFRVLLESDPTPFYIVGRLITVVFAVATVPVLFAIGRRVAGVPAAVAAAAFLILAPAHIDKSQVIEVDVPLTFFVTLGCLLAVRVAEAPTRRDLALGGIAAGLAASTKYPGGLVLLPLAVALVLGSRPRAGSPPTESLRSALGSSPLWLGMAILAASSLTSFALTSPFVFLDPVGFQRDVLTQRQHMLLGHFGVSPESGWGYYARALFGDLLGPLLAVGGLAGLLVFSIVRRERWAVVLASFAVPYLVLFSSWSMKADRYLLPVVPLLALYAAAGLALAPRGVLRGASSARARGLAVAVGALVCAVPLVIRYPAVYARTRPDTRTIAKQWLQANYPGGCFVVTEAYGPRLMNPLEMGRMGTKVFRELTRRRWEAPFYAVQFLPLFQVGAQRSAKFYDFSLYRDVADLVITSGAVRGRYEQDTVLYRPQLAFYDSLERRFTRVQVFAPTGGPGPEIVIYRNPRLLEPLWKRQEVPGPDPEALSRGGSTGEEAFFLFNLGMNYEAFGFHEAAFVCYGLGRQFPQDRQGLASDFDLGAARCLLALGSRADAMALLQEAEARASSGLDRRKIASFREALLAPER